MPAASFSNRIAALVLPSLARYFDNTLISSPIVGSVLIRYGDAVASLSACAPALIISTFLRVASGAIARLGPE